MIKRLRLSMSSTPVDESQRSRLYDGPRNSAAERARAFELGSPGAYWLLGLTLTYLTALFTWTFFLTSPTYRSATSSFRDLVKDSPSPTFLDALFRYDAPYYSYLAMHGYAPGDKRVAFYPLYPPLIRSLSQLLFGDASENHIRLCGLLISAIASLVVVIILNQLCRIFLNDASRHLCLILWVLSPTAVFLTMAYTEALFLALVLGGFLLVQRRHWLGAGGLIGLACLTRPVGVFAYMGFLAESFISKKGEPDSRFHRFMGLALPAFAIAGYHAYQFLFLGDALAGVHAEQRFWNQFFLMPWKYPQFIALSLAIAPIRPDYAAVVGISYLYLLTSFLCLGRMLGSTRIPISFKIYSALVVLSIICRTSDMSIARFLMVAFPFQMVAANWGAQGSDRRSFLLILLFLTLDIFGTAAFVGNQSFF
jgi:hypothetical protein